MPTLWPKHPTLCTSISATTCVEAPGFAIRFGCCKVNCKRNKKQQRPFSMLMSRLLTGIWYFYWKVLSSKLFWDDKTYESHRTYSVFIQEPIRTRKSMQSNNAKLCNYMQNAKKIPRNGCQTQLDERCFCVSHQKRRRPMLWESYNVVISKQQTPILIDIFNICW